MALSFGCGLCTNAEAPPFRPPLTAPVPWNPRCWQKWGDPPLSGTTTACNACQVSTSQENHSPCPHMYTRSSMDPLTCCCRAMCGHLIFFRHALAAAMVEIHSCETREKQVWVHTRSSASAARTRHIQPLKSLLCPPARLQRPKGPPCSKGP